MKGITGSIGAGKSLVGAILREHKIRVIDADVAVHQLYRDNTALRKAIAKEFGADILTEKGISRSRMASISHRCRHHTRALSALRLSPLLL